MRSSLVLASALVVGAIAGPIRQRDIVTEVDLEVVTVTVYVTPGQAEPTAEASTTHTRHHHTKSSTSDVPSSSSAPPAYSVPESSTVVVAPSSTSVYTPEPTPTSTAVPESSTAAASSSDVVTSQASSTTSAAGGDHPTGTIQGTLSTGADYQAAVLYHHNAARANHGAGELTWCDDCEANARTVAEGCNFEHYIPDGAGQGQNLFTLSGDSFNVTAGITESWYKGEFEPMLPYFGQADVPDSVFEQVGHLTQMLWKDTTSVGCVSYDCGSKMMVGGQSSDMNKYTVCNYAPAGNYAGEYGKQVGSPISDSKLGSWSD